MDRLITAGEIKNWAYCQRVVYYRRCMPEASRATFKMREAIRAQEMIERLETRRTLQAYGVEGHTRRFGLWLTWHELGIGGKLDLLLENGSEAIPVDFKLSGGEPGENHRMQLALYGVLVEKTMALHVPRALLYRIPDDRVYEIPLDDSMKVRVREAVEAIREMERNEVLPEATAVRARCTDCEYANYCGDVW